MHNIDFSQIQIHAGSQSKGFEELVCQLASLSKPENAKEFIRKDGAGGDAGVECYWKLQDGSEHAWQAKYFLKPLGPSQWKQISRSVKSALSKHPNLTKYYICLPRDRTDSRRSSTAGSQIPSELDKWNQHIARWKAIAAVKSMQVEFEYWGEHEILLMLQRDTSDFVGIARHWFGPPIHPTYALPYRYFPIDIVDQKIKDETSLLRKSRFFAEFDRAGASLVLTRKIVEGELSGGTNTVKCQALAWCVRILSHSEELDEAEKYLRYAKGLGTCQEINIADAYILSQKGDKKAALMILSDIDSPMSRSAAFMIVKHHDGSQEAIDWMKSAGIDASDLDSDGKFSLLKERLDRADWETAQKCLDVLTNDDLRDTPVLHDVKAMTHLLSTVHDEFRSVVLNQLPLRAADFPLASDATAIEARRIARQHFINAAEVASQLNLPRAETIYNEYALWLELRDPNESDKGRERLKDKLRDLKSALHFVRLGIEFDLPLDLDAVEREIERQTALNGGITLEAALARFALIFTQKTPGDAENYIAQHRDELANHIDKQTMLSLQIDLLSQTGQLDKANECLGILLEEGLSEAEERRLRIIISRAEGTDPVEGLKDQFKKTGSLSDLVNLVVELGTRGDLENLCAYSEFLFEETRALHNAEEFASTLHKTQKNKQLIEFLESNKTIVEQSDKLQMLYCWTLYLEGELLKARSELAKLDDDWDNENYRTLQVNLAITLGDWNFLSAFIAKECNEKEKRNAQELIHAAQLALRLDSIPHAKELTLAAVEKGEDNAYVLGRAYLIAANAGWEDNRQVSQWIQQAAALSGENGPFQMMTLTDLLNQKPEWERQEYEIWKLLSQGEIPILLASQYLNKSLSDLMLFPAWANLSKSDPRRRGIIPAYSGQRQPLSLDTSRQIGMDATALLTLGFLNLLDEALDAFDMVHIPHSTLGWLLDEKQRVAFHQPSRIRDAHHVRDLLAKGALEKFSPSTVSDSGLSEQVGEELALFIAEAEKTGREDDLHRIVVQPSPVHRVGSLMEEEADLAAYETVLSSCQSIVDKLREKGQITANEAQKARAYLQFHEKPWPHQPDIADEAILYLDDLAVNYFLHLGILEKLQATGFKLIISPAKESETNQLISYESISDRVKDAIERIRLAVNSRIKSKKIKVDRLTHADQSEDWSVYERLTAGILSLAKSCDAIILDDRCINQFVNVGDDDLTTPIFSTLDLIDALFSTGNKTAEERLNYRTLLRQAGYIFVPVSEDELAHHLDASIVRDGKVFETAELKAIRENILCIRMTTWLQISKDAPWLNTLLQVFSRALRDLWKSDADFSGTRARSDWIMSQIDIRGWAHSFGKEDGDSMVKTGRGAYILLLLTPLVDVSREVQDEYWGWVEERILAPIKEQYPDLYSWFVDWQRRWIVEMADMDITQKMRSDE